MEPNTSKLTFFDSPERLPSEDVLQEILWLKQNALMNQLLEGFPELALVLNEHRQIVAFNSRALTAFRTDNYFDIVGKRLGEAIHCIHSDSTENGCGTSQFCRQCGAARAIKASIENAIKASQECRITTECNGSEVSLDFLVHTQPIHIGDKDYTLFTVQDISHEKRREALEKIFFHDVLNTAGALKGLSDILVEIEDENERNQIQHAIYTSANQLVHEITAQRELRVAEDGNLEPSFEKIYVNKILESVAELYLNHPLNNFNNLVVDFPENDIVITTDPSLLIRSLGNLIKNALEASRRDQKVKLCCELTETEIMFQIKSEPIIPEHVQHQLFKRSFSTKQSKGRGIGLYSVKLIAEQFLRGKVSFQSNTENKTVFTVTLPVTLNI